ncbi:MAG: Microtubule-associated protein, microtubule dynamics during spindle orientation [Peltula sp. TS41687]|nr:MAG: Microtubule-associated protein, microtubule dynamics during spindle orientation [Peltula sp. TS41687]
MADQEQTDYSALPLLDRFVHKVWKVRKEAYEEAARRFEAAPSESDPVYKPFLQDPGLWKGAVADSNVAAQQEGIAALCAFLKFAGTPACTRTRNQAIPPLVEKGLTSTRAATKASATEALLLYIELDTPGPVIDELIPFLSHKQPKTIAATLNALTTIYHAYGCKTADPKPVLKALPKVFGHADKNVRAEAQNLAVELYRWLKEALKPVLWNDLKPVQQQDLEALFEKVKQDPSPRQERLLRSQQDAPAPAGEEDGDAPAVAEEVDEGPEEVDAFDLVVPVEVASKIPGDLYENLASTKWKARKDSLDELYAVINIPRIKDADFSELVRALAKCMKDANVTVVTVAANCVEALANGTRAGFSKYRSLIMSPMMERLKEKKQLVADALGAAMDGVFTSTSLSDCLDDTLEFMKHKNPQVKLESVRFLIRCLRNTKEVPTKAEVKLISDAATKLLTESTEVLRSSGAEILGTIMKIMGERSMNPYLEGLDEIRRTKIKEFYEKAEVKAKDKPKPAAPPAAAAAPKGTKAPVGRKGAEKKPAAGPAKGASNSGPATEDAKPTGRSIPSKLGPHKPTATGAASGLKLQKKPGGPGGSASAAPSPMKQPVSHPAPAPAEEETTSVPKFGLGGRGLAGRPLGRPTPVTHFSETAAPAGSSLKPQERVELEELRAENERLRRNDEELRTERSKLMSEIHELQNQNAQLIEDHTRNMLSLKAKETQLVRARSDAEAAEQMCQKQQREMERLKRELSRAVRSASPTGPNDVSEQIYRDTGLNGMAPPPYGANHGRPMVAKRPTYGSNFGEEKENGGPLDAVDLRGGMKMTSPTLSSAVSSQAGGRNSPTVDAGAGGGGGGLSGGTTTNNGEGIESWKRAAEVTSQLKARIEQMKARQGISKP